MGCGMSDGQQTKINNKQANDNRMIKARPMLGKYNGNREAS